MEDERRFTLQFNRDGVNRITEAEEIGSMPAKQNEADTRFNARFAELQQSLNNLSNQMRGLPQARKTPYCGYCRKQDHTPASCPLNPPRGACFDCLQLGCKKGNVTCPGRQSRQSRHAQ